MRWTLGMSPCWRPAFSKTLWSIADLVARYDASGGKRPR